MITELLELIKKQNEDLKELLMLLELQYKMIMDNDVFGLEGLVDKLGQCSKRIAQEEVERRKIIGSQSISRFIREMCNAELTQAYEDVKETLKKTSDQKKTNDILLKQQLLITNKMLAMMNPSREMKTYNSYGNLSK